MTARVCIVGAGPVGVVAAIALARKDIRVALFEAEREIDHSPRAATTHPSTLEMLAELGLLEEFQSVGLVARHFQFWDGATKALVAEFDHQVLRDERLRRPVPELEVTGDKAQRLELLEKPELGEHLERGRVSGGRARAVIDFPLRLEERDPHPLAGAGDCGDDTDRARPDDADSRRHRSRAGL